MVVIMGLMCVGIGVGYALRRRLVVIRNADRAVISTLCFLLFFLGAAMGRDPAVRAQLHSLALTSLLLAVGMTAGCLLVSALVLDRFFSHHET